VPLVLDSPHSGERYPDDFDHAPPRALVRRAEDTHVARLWRGAVRHGATLIEACFPRAYIDPNRSLDDLDPDLLAEAWDGPLVRSRKTEQGIGLVWRLARGGVPMYARRLRAAEIRRRIDAFYLPYHAALAAELDAMHGRFGAVWHVDCHSMPAIGDVNSDDPGRARADFVLGDRDGTTCGGEFTAEVVAALRVFGYDVAINDPYKGVEIVRRHGRPSRADTACRSRSTGVFTWTRRRSRPMPVMRRSRPTSSVSPRRSQRSCGHAPRSDDSRPPAAATGRHLIRAAGAFPRFPALRYNPPVLQPRQPFLGQTPCLHKKTDRYACAANSSSATGR
jgi:N-formylglutamate deformylase